MNDRWLVVRVKAGLGNRLRAVASVLRLAERFHRNPAVLWTPDSSCGAPFGDLFEARDWVFSTLQELQRRLAPSPGERLLRVGDPPWGPLVLDLGVTAARVVLVETWSTVLDKSDRVDGAFPKSILQELRPHLLGMKVTSPVASTIEHEAAKHGMAERVGIHIRQTDHPAGGTTSLQQFLEAAATYPAAQSFFVAADNAHAKATMCASLAGRCIARSETEYQRALSSSISDALIDLYLLSKTRGIISTGSSSFSRVAAVLGGIPLTELGYWPPPPGYAIDPF